MNSASVSVVIAAYNAGHTLRATLELVGPLAARLTAFQLDRVSGCSHRQMLLGNPISCPAQVLIPRRVVEVTETLRALARAGAR